MDNFAGPVERGCRQETLLSAPPLTVSTIDCSGWDDRWFESPIPTHPSIVIIRAGILDRRVYNVVSTLDATQVYLRQPGEPEQVRSRGPAGYRCTVITTDPAVVPRLWPLMAGLAAPEWRSEPSSDLAHRHLLAACRQAGDLATLRALARVVADSLIADRTTPVVVARQPRQSERARRAVDIVRQVVARPGPSTSLTTIARELEITPNYLSTIFRLGTGLTITRYRARLRVRLALEWLADGQADLSRIAHELGFADHAHFSRTVMSELGVQPREARRLVCPPSSRRLPISAPARRAASLVTPPRQEADTASLATPPVRN